MTALTVKETLFPPIAIHAPQARGNSLAAAWFAKRNPIEHHLGNQEILDLKVVKAGGVELHHLHVGADRRFPD